MGIERDCDNYKGLISGCADVVVHAEAPPRPWPTDVGYRWDVRAVPARAGAGLEHAFSTSPSEGENRFRIRRYVSPTPQGDTASFMVHARLLAVPQPVPVGQPLPVFAADSALILVDFGSGRRRPPVYTVRLSLRPTCADC